MLVSDAVSKQKEAYWNRVIRHISTAVAVSERSLNETRAYTTQTHTHTHTDLRDTQRHTLTLSLAPSLSYTHTEIIRYADDEVLLLDSTHFGPTAT